MKRKEKMHTGKLHLPGGAGITTEQAKHLDRMCGFRHTCPAGTEKRAAPLREMFAEIGERDRGYDFGNRKINRDTPARENEAL